MKREQRGQRGQGVVEFAMILPLLVVLVIGIIDLGNGYQTYILLTNAAREGAHYGINHARDTGGICAQARHALTTDFSVTCDVYYGVLQDESGNCDTSATTPTVGKPVCVKISYTMNPIVGAIVRWDAITNIRFDAIPITTWATMIVFNT